MNAIRQDAELRVQALQGELGGTRVRLKIEREIAETLRRRCNTLLWCLEAVAARQIPPDGDIVQQVLKENRGNDNA